MNKKFDELSKLLKNLEDKGFHDCVLSFAYAEDCWVCYWDGYEISSPTMEELITTLKEKMIATSISLKEDPSSLELFAELCDRRNGK
ncbi:MAG: hypothetical protein ACRCZ0_09365 [Cetobacterium sp.]